MPDDAAPFFSPGQRRLVGAAGAALALASLVAMVILAAIGAARFLGHFSGVIWPLAVAVILALVLRPLVAALERRFRLGRVPAVIVLYAAFLLASAGLVLSFAPAIVAQILDFVAYLPTLWDNTLAWAGAHFPDWLAMARKHLDNPAVKSALAAAAAEAQDLATRLVPSLQSAGAGLVGLFRLAASLAVVPVYLFFFLLTDEDPTRNLPEHLPFLRAEHRDDVVFLAREFLGIVVAFFRGQLLIGLIMGVLLATGFSVAGLRFGLALGLLMGLLNVVPYLGSILGLCVALPLALFQDGGGWWLAGACLGVFAAVQALEGWVLTPRIMGSRTGLHPVAIIVAVFFWGQAIGGLLGMMLAVPLTAFLVTAWRLLRRKYFNAAGV